VVFSGKRILQGRRLTYSLAAGFLLICLLQVALLAVLYVSQQKQGEAWRQQQELVSTAINHQKTMQELFEQTQNALLLYLKTGQDDVRTEVVERYKKLVEELKNSKGLMNKVGGAPAESLESARKEVEERYKFNVLNYRLSQPVPIKSPEDLIGAAVQAEDVRRKLSELGSALTKKYDELESDKIRLDAVKLVGITSLVLVALVITGYIGWLSLRAVRFFRQAEEERSVAERQGKFFKAVLDQLPAGVSVRSAPDGGTVMVNRAARQIMGQVRIPQSVTQITTEGVYHPDATPYQAAELPMMRSLMKGETVNSEEMVLEYVGGERSTVLCSSKPILDDNRTITAAITIYQDITDRKKLEWDLEAKTKELDRLVEEQQRQITRLTQMQEISAKVSVQKTAQDICREVLPAVASMMGLEKCFLQLADPEMRQLKVIGPAHGITDAQLADIPALPIVWDDSPTMQAFWADKPLLLNDAASAPEAQRYHALFHQLHVRSAAYFRLAAHGKSAGLLAVFDRRDGQPFNEQDVQLLHILANHIAVALDSARLYESLRERNDQLATLLQEAHHRIKNNLAMVTSLLSLEMSYGLDKSSAQICASTIGRIESIARVHALLTQDSTHGVPVQPLIEQLVQSLTSSSLNPHQRINVDYKIAPLYLPSREATALALVTNELLSNAFRHGFVGRGSGAVHVELQKGKEDEVTLTITNDGNPMPAESESRVGLGLRIVEALARRDLKGKFSVSGNNGQTVATVHFRLPQHPIEPLPQDPSV
jgi:PAS domain S-box-containing protein